MRAGQADAAVSPVEKRLFGTIQGLIRPRGLLPRFSSIDEIIV